MITLQDIQREHKELEEEFDLGSPKILRVDILDDIAVVTNSNECIWGETCKVQDLGKKVAFSILIELEASSCDFGSWLSKPYYPQYEEILKYKEEDFELNTELCKFWIISRVISNMKREPGKAYMVMYDSDSRMTYTEER
jgi:hypothetical protein